MPPVHSSMDNPVAIGFVILMLILLLVIFMLAQLLLGIAQVKMQKEKDAATAVTSILPVVILLLLCSSPTMAQSSDNGTGTAVHVIAGLSSTAFYIMTSVVFVELLVIFMLLLNVKVLLKVDREKVAKKEMAAVWNERLKNWWIKLNSFKAPEQEADIDLGHDYDGIRELDNRLPPWWLYGFYITIVVAGIYLYRFHVSHNGPSAVEEYETAIAKADVEIKEYLETKGESVDENTVTMLTDAGDLAEGKTIFIKSCVACHSEGGAGSVGPNLTDDYWLHGGDIKSVFKTIRYGVNAMPQWQNTYSNKQIAELSSFVRSLRGTHPANAKPPQGALESNDAAPGRAADSTLQTASLR